MDDVRLTNYITLIKNINKAIGQGEAFEDEINEDMRYIIDTKSRRNFLTTEDKKARQFFSMFNAVTERVSALAFEMLGFRTPLKFIYDYGKCNIYARVIMEISKYSFDNLNARNNAYLEIFDGNKKRITNAREFIYFCRNNAANDGYKFIFWALMILTVDKRNAEEHLSLICDYANLIGITDDEFEDIIQIVKFIYDLDDLKRIKKINFFGIIAPFVENSFKSERVPSIFSELLSLMRNNSGVVTGVTVNSK